VAQAAAIAGTGASAHVGTGALVAGVAVIAASGTSASTGTGTLVAGSAAVAGYQAFPLPITGDVSLGGWTDQDDGVIDIFESIDEDTPNDSDFVKSSNDPSADVYRYALDTPGAPVFPFIIDYRHAKAGTAPLQFTIRLMQGTTMIAQASGLQSETITTNRLMLTEAEFNSITDFSDLFIELEADAA